MNLHCQWCCREDYIYTHTWKHFSSVVFKPEPFAVPEGTDTVNLDEMISDTKILVTYILPVEAFAMWIIK